MKYIQLFLSVFLGGSMVLSCAGSGSEGEAPAENYGALRKVYVEAAAPEQVHVTDGKLAVKITGNLPSPAYQFSRFDVQVKGNVITVTPLAEYDSTKMAAQVLVPFEQVCTVESLQPGNYIIEIHGRGEKTVRTETVDVER